MIIGERIKDIRIAKNLSQGDIEHKTGLLRCYISRVENGHTVPAIETLEKIARAMDIEMYQFFLSDGKRPEQIAGVKSGNETVPRDNQFRQITSAWPKINRRDRNILRKMATQFAKG